MSMMLVTPATSESAWADTSVETIEHTITTTNTTKFLMLIVSAALAEVEYHWGLNTPLAACKNKF